MSFSTKKKALIGDQGLFKIKAWRCPTLTWGDPTLPSALSIFTSEFEMGSGGSYSLLPPGISVRCSDRFVNLPLSRKLQSIFPKSKHPE